MSILLAIASPVLKLVMGIVFERESFNAPMTPELYVIIYWSW